MTFKGMLGKFVVRPAVGYLKIWDLIIEGLMTIADGMVSERSGVHGLENLQQNWWDYKRDFIAMEVFILHVELK